MKLKYLKATLSGIVFSVGCLFNVANAGLIITQNDNANDLVTNILGSGITTSNVSNVGAENAFGTFSGGLSAGIAIESGIMLSTGYVNDASGPNTVDDITTDFGTPGDADLAALSGFDTYDAAFLTFDFTSDGGDLFFRYVFASEEYNEFANANVNDTFAFFLDGVNIALIPGTNTPVSINTINGGNPFGTNGQNSHLFNNNSLSDGGPFFDIEYDGFTDVFTAQAIGLSPGNHNIRLGIADGGDAILDSSVFIEAGSFSDEEPSSVPEPPMFAIFPLAIIGLVLFRAKRQA